MAGELDDGEFSAIYESIDDTGSSGDEYVTVSQPTPYPMAYLCPEPHLPAPSPPAAGGGRELAKRPKLRLPITPSNKPTSKYPGNYESRGHDRTNPLPLPERSPARKRSGYKKLVNEPSQAHPKPKRLPKPAILARGANPVPTPRRYQSPAPAMQGGSVQHDYLGGTGTTVPASPPRHQPHPPPPPSSPSQPQACYINTPEANEYDSIKETRKMLAARRKHKKESAAAHTAAAAEHGDIELGTMSGKALSSSVEELILGGGGGKGRGQQRIVCILLSIAVVSLLIAVVSMAMALYTVAALTKSHVVCKEIPLGNSTVNVNMTVDTTIDKDKMAGSSVSCMVYSTTHIPEDCVTTATLLRNMNSSDSYYCRCSMEPEGKCTQLEEEVECIAMGTTCEYTH